MKKYIFIILTTLISINAFTQAIDWERNYGGSEIDALSSVYQTPDGGYIVGGTITTIDSIYTSYDYHIIKIDEAGFVEWEQTFGGNLSDVCGSIDQTTDGGYIIGGSSPSLDGDFGSTINPSDIWIVKTDSKGNLEWKKKYGGSADDECRSIQQTADDGYIFGGLSNSSDGDVSGDFTARKVWIVKTDVNGIIEWENSYGGSNNEQYGEILQTADGGFILGGYLSINLRDYWVVKIDANGTIEWEKTYGGAGADLLSAIQQTTDGGFILGGFSAQGEGFLNYDYWIIKIDAIGNIEWEKNYGGDENDQLSSIQQTTDGGFILGGQSFSNNGDVGGNYGGNDYWIIKIDAIGNIEWEKNYGGDNTDICRALQETSDGGFIVGGFSTSTNYDVSGNIGNHDYWLVKIIDCNGIVDGINATDDCGICDNDPSNDNESCTDCAGVVNGTNAIDECGVCDDDPTNDNSTCTDCLGVVNGINTMDECGVCDDDLSNDNLTCSDCAGIANGPNTVDECDVCDDDLTNDNFTCQAIVSSTSSDLDFGALPSMSSSSLPLNIQNLGEEALEVSDFIFNDSVFSSETNTFTISGNAEETVTIHFNPSEIKKYESTLNIKSNADDLAINLIGEGILETGVETINNNVLTISPNPSTGVFVLNFNKINAQNINLKIYDVSGRCILNQSTTSHQTEIDLSTAANGIYYLNVETASDVFIEKLMKSK